MDEVIRIKIRDLNPHIVCSLCAGYFIDATTITECLHTFCKSCVVKFLHTSKCCPQCGQKVHETQPLQNLKADRVLQDIIFKIVPGLYENEKKRIEDFNGPNSKEGETTLSSGYLGLAPNDQGPENDRMICFHLENYSEISNPQENISEFKHLASKFIQCSERACVINIKEFVKKYFNLGSVKVDILSGLGSPLDDWITLRKLWLLKAPHNMVIPIKLYYQVLKNS